MPTLATAIDAVLEFCTLFLIVQIIISWLIGYGVIDAKNPHVAAIRAFFVRSSDPVLKPIRLILPASGDVDMSPIVVILLMLTARYVMVLYPMA